VIQNDLSIYRFIGAAGRCRGVLAAGLLLIR
jgi:hypothetical protein